MEQVSELRYLGSLISEDRYCTKSDSKQNWDCKKVFMKKKKFITG